MTIHQGDVTAGSLRFGYLEAGDGPLAVCLHGFPDSAWGWQHLLPALADAGYRAVAPFMRGYSPTEVAPDGVYQTGALAHDACRLHEALGGGPDAIVIGHDWGAPAAYGAANLEPERWRRVVGAAVPPGGALAQAFTSYDQLQRSWYMFFFQHALADAVVPMDDMAFIDRLWDDWSPGFDATAAAARAKDALRDPANLTAALGYYRATLGDGPRDPALADAQAATGRIPEQPLLYLHGVDDGCIGIDVVAGVPAELTDEASRMVVVDGAGHFLQLEQPDLVNALILDFLAEN